MVDIYMMYNIKVGWVFDVCNILFFGGVGVIIILLFLYIIVGFFVIEVEFVQCSFFIFLKIFIFDVYKYVFLILMFI